MFVVMKSSNSMEKKINNDYWQTKEICTFDVGEFIDKVFSKYQQMAEAGEISASWVKTSEELRELWDKVMRMPIQGDASLYPNNEGTQPALMEVWHKAGDFWRAGFRADDELICDQHGLPLRKWMIKAIKEAKGEAQDQQPVENDCPRCNKPIQAEIDFKE